MFFFNTPTITSINQPIPNNFRVNICIIPLPVNKKRLDTNSSDIVKVDRLKSLIQSTFLLYLE